MCQVALAQGRERPRQEEPWLGKAGEMHYTCLAVSPGSPKTWAEAQCLPGPNTEDSRDPDFSPATLALTGRPAWHAGHALRVAVTADHTLTAPGPTGVVTL